MQPWWKRLLYSFIAVILGGGITGTVASFRDVLVDSAVRLDPKSVIFSGLIVAVFSLFGWIVAVPVVLIVNDYSGSRLWRYAIVGACVGPALILLMDAIQYVLEHPHFADLVSANLVFLVLGTGVSVLSTAIYLLLVRGDLTKLERPSLKDN